MNSKPFFVLTAVITILLQTALILLGGTYYRKYDHPYIEYFSSYEIEATVISPQGIVWNSGFSDPYTAGPGERVKIIFFDRNTPTCIIVNMTDEGCTAYAEGVSTGALSYQQGGFDPAAPGSYGIVSHGSHIDSTFYIYVAVLGIVCLAFLIFNIPVMIRLTSDMGGRSREICGRAVMADIILCAVSLMMIIWILSMIKIF